MFSCRACTRRALNVLFENAIPLETNRATLRKCFPPKSSPGARTHATASIVAKERKGTTLTEDDDDNPKRRVSKSAESAVKKQLQYLDDPLFIAQQVQRTLARDRFEEAALLVRNASRKYKVPVSWNHLIEYQLRNHRLHAAIKLYNEMKKRGQLPTAQTYTIIFKGCAQSPHSKLAVSEATKLYNNMLASERMTPNTIHMNAVLQVCARAEDIETMFTVVKSADDNIRGPNTLTYTTILNALRNKVDKRQVDKDIPEGALDDQKQQTIQRAKQIWDEVLAKWRSASIVIDEELVCALGRILLLGNYSQNNDVLSVIEQTMNIPRDTSALSNLAWKGTLPEKGDKAEGGNTMSGKPVLKFETKSRKITSSTTYARPGNNSLSLVLSAIQNTGQATLARRYWTVFTNNYGVIPDAENWHALFKTLRRGKSSTTTVEYLAVMPKSLMSPKIFRTTMYTCLRDNLNKSAFNNATQILEVMLTSVRIPDMQTLRTYLQVAYANKRLFQEMAKKDVNGAKLAWGRQLNLALQNLWEPYHIAAKQFAFGGLGPVPARKFVDDDERAAWVKDAAPRAELAALARKMIAGHDRLIFDNMVPPEVAKSIEPRRNMLNRFVVQYFEDRERLEPGWNRKLQEIEAGQEAEDGGFHNRRAVESW
ncbi:hypothetical protein BJ170DRAFT_621810 [Xylariales sp. AK1849]|nr:hypothetical protein BJ170DRAFT_621810 [Xylariales sp. AK1849]